MAEARRRGESWANIAEDLGVKTSAAHRRFGSAQTGDAGCLASTFGLNTVTIASQAADTPTSIRIPVEELGEDGDPEIRPEVYFRNSIRRLVNNALAYDKHIYLPYKSSLEERAKFIMPEEWWIGLQEITNEFKTGVWDLVRSGSIGALLGKNKYWPAPPYIDESPGVYLSYACYHAAASAEHLGRLADDLNKDCLDDFHKDIEMAYNHQQSMMEILLRPECLVVIQLANGSESD